METTVSEINELDRRGSGRDRRQNQKRSAFHSIYKKRRVNHRRTTDLKEAIYVDKHDPYVVALALGIMLLCICDAFFTLKLISYGSSELNPMLAPLIEKDISTFLAIKFFITGIAVSFLVMHRYHKIFNLISGFHLLVFSTLIYLALVIYELTMIRHLPIIY